MPISTDDVFVYEDNAGTFDRLLPLLDLQSMYVLAVDLPGHGFSSHLPEGGLYTDLTWVIELKRIVDHLKWTKFSMLGHSMGANASLHFALLFPDLVERVITIDTVKPAVFPVTEHASRLAKDIDNFLALEERNQRLKKDHEFVFTYDRAISALKLAHSAIGTLTAEGAACLLKRATKIKRQPSGESGYVFTRDYRLQNVINRKTDGESLKHYLSGIKCELLIINAKSGLFTDRELQKVFIEMYADKCPKFEYLEVDGDHYVHLTRPHDVAPHIKRFLSPAIDELKATN
ncbi:unnamed protein product [Oppiella nova]|uniref:AB hydrolase-1 domain-containing protein n=1 Tax=Oppiella nova TaxID=334625 RepID=A0A7R9QXJ7_9ACAR|nr:unnamed protein product [Oppiella nova]CAG2178088.1 unnamed protein product [Oppiella nova]